MFGMFSGICGVQFHYRLSEGTAVTNRQEVQ